ncbi:MAG: DUF1116 domain-containing protein [Halobacteriaceae archaeon]
MTDDELFEEDLDVVNVGLDRFRDAIASTGTSVVDVDWSPPPGVDEDLNDALTALAEEGETIAAATQTAFERMTEATPIWTDIGTARDEIPGMDEYTLFHAGPPVTWDRMSGPQRGAVMGAMVYEGWADTPEEAAELAAAGEVEFDPCHDHQSVAPMAGIISPSMPVFIVENETHGNVAYSNLMEGRGEALRFGAYAEDVIERLHWMEEELAPVLQSAVRHVDGVNVKSHIARALQMGDEVHNRNVAATSILLRTLLPGLVASDEPPAVKQRVAEFLEKTNLTFLNAGMAGNKAAADAAAGVEWSSVVTVMTRNGTDFGIRISGLDDEWFTAQAPKVDGLYFPEYSEEDAARDMGDSTIAETAGVGGFAMAAAPAITDFVGGTPQDAVNRTLEMYEITVGENPNYTIPALDFRGTPTGIDMLRVIDSGVRPFINTGIAHKEPGVGQVGAGLVHAPRECFLQAIRSYTDRYL